MKNSQQAQHLKESIINRVSNTLSAQKQGSNKLSQDSNDQGQHISEPHPSYEQINKWKNFSSKYLTDKVYQLSNICEQIPQLETFNRTLQFAKLQTNQKTAFFKIVEVLISLHHKVSYLSRNKPALMKEMQNASAEIFFLNECTQSFLKQIDQEQPEIFAINFTGFDERKKSQLSEYFTELKQYLKRLTEIIISQDLFHTQNFDRIDKLMKLVSIFYHVITESHEYGYGQEWENYAIRLSENTLSKEQESLFQVLNECLKIYHMKPLENNFSQSNARTNQELEEEVNKLIEDYEKLKQDNECLADSVNREREEYTIQIEERDNMINNLAAIKLSLEKKIEKNEKKYEQSRKSSQEEIAKYQQSLNAYKQQLKISENERQRLLQMLEEEQSKYLRVYETITKLKPEREKLLLTIDQLNESIDSIKQDNNKILSRLNKKILELQNQKEILENELNSSQKNKIRLVERCDQAQKKMHDYIRKMQDKSGDSEHDTRSQIRFERENDRLKEIIKELQAQSKMVAHQLLQNKSKLRECKTKIEAYQEKQDQMNDLQSKVDKLSYKNEKLIQQMEEIKAETDSNEKKMRAYQKKIKEQESENYQLQQQRITLKRQIEDLLRRMQQSVIIEEKRQLEKRLNLEIDRLSDEINRLRAELEKLIKDLSEKQHIITIEKQRNEQYMREIMNYQKVIDSIDDQPLKGQQEPKSSHKLQKRVLQLQNLLEREKQKCHGLERKLLQESQIHQNQMIKVFSQYEGQMKKLNDDNKRQRQQQLQLANHKIQLQQKLREQIKIHQQRNQQNDLSLSLTQNVYQNQNLKIKISEVESEKSNNEIDFEQQKNIIQSLEKQNKMMAGKLVILEQQLLNVIKQKAADEQRRVLQIAKSDQLGIQRQAYKTQLNQLKDRLYQLHTQLNDYKNKNETLQKDNRLNGELKSVLQNELNKIKPQNQFLGSKLQDAEQYIHFLVNDLNMLVPERDRLLQQLQEANQKLANIKMVIDQYSAFKQQHKRLIEDINRIKQNQKAQIERSLRTQFQGDYLQKIESIKSQSNQQIERLLRDIQQHKTVYQKVLSQKSQWKLDLQKLQQIVNTQQRQKELLINKMENLNKRGVSQNDSEPKVLSLQNQLKSLKQKYSRSLQQIDKGVILRKQQGIHKQELEKQRQRLSDALRLKQFQISQLQIETQLLRQFKNAHQTIKNKSYTDNLELDLVKSQQEVANTIQQISRLKQFFAARQASLMDRTQKDSATINELLKNKEILQKQNGLLNQSVIQQSKVRMKYQTQSLKLTFQMKKTQEQNLLLHNRVNEEKANFTNLLFEFQSLKKQNENVRHENNQINRRSQEEFNKMKQTIGKYYLAKINALELALKSVTKEINDYRSNNKELELKLASLTQNVEPYEEKNKSKQKGDHKQKQHYLQVVTKNQTSRLVNQNKKTSREISEDNKKRETQSPNKSVSAIFSQNCELKQEIKRLKLVLQTQTTERFQGSQDRIRILNQQKLIKIIKESEEREKSLAADNQNLKRQLSKYRDDCNLKQTQLGSKETQSRVKYQKITSMPGQAIINNTYQDNYFLRSEGQKVAHEVEELRRRNDFLTLKIDQILKNRTISGSELHLVDILRRNNMGAYVWQVQQILRENTALREFVASLKEENNHLRAIQTNSLSVQWRQNLTQFVFRILCYFSEIEFNSNEAASISNELESLAATYQGGLYFTVLEEYTVHILENNAIEEYKRQLRNKARQLLDIKERLDELITKQIQQEERIYNKSNSRGELIGSRLGNSREVLFSRRRGHAYHTPNSEVLSNHSTPTQINK